MVTALVDGDILRYEIGYAAETGWKSIVGEEGLEDAPLPPFDYVASLLHMRLDQIKFASGADDALVYLTEGDCFRNYIATVKPYKGHRQDKKPWHHKNISAYIKAALSTKVVSWIEADDAMAITQTDALIHGHSTIICTRDKDLRQVPGKFFSWELGNQPQYGPMDIDPVGTLTFENNHLFGTGFKWFMAQTLVGDAADNIPGLPKYGPVRAFSILDSLTTPQQMLDAVIKEYKEVYDQDWEARLTEQGQLLWIVREVDIEGQPVIWQIGMN